MINFDVFESQVSSLATSYKQAKPFEHVVLKNFCIDTELRTVVTELLGATDIGLSRDFVFAKNKGEAADFRRFGPKCDTLYQELISSRFQELLSAITGEEVFVDPAFHGGGFHKGGAGSYLDMHTDFNYHPSEKTWFRMLNIILYLNEEWLSSYGGELRLRNTEDASNAEMKIPPLFNNAVLMLTDDYTLHGYDPISFPKGAYRMSIATYAYTLHESPGKLRSTTWRPDAVTGYRHIIGPSFHKLVAIKNRFFGSRTKKNR